MNDNDIIQLLEYGYAWTAKRIAVVQEGELENTTPCGEWQLLRLLDHTFGSGRLLSAMAASEIEAGPEATQEFVNELIEHGHRVADPVAMFTERVGAPSIAVWRTPGLLDGEVTAAFGKAPARTILQLNLLEVVTHGWDISQSTGEAATIPGELARPILEFARQVVTDPRIAPAFGPAVTVPATAPVSDALVALLGRTPLPAL
jgi:uncharacterized protein (TIGR03086 family)